MNRRTMITGGIGAVAIAAAAIGLSVGLPTGANEAEAESQPEKTAKITKQDLADTETKSGTLAYGNTTKVTGKAQGTVTSLPAAGTVIERGQALYKVDDLPVVLFYGSLPLYRTVKPGMEGNDVKQVTENLKALGYSFTTSSIKRWQDKLGLPETGVIEPGRVVHAIAAIRVATVSASIGDTANREILTYTGTKRQVISTLEANDSRLAKAGEKVKVTLPDNKTVDGTIESTRTVIQQSQNEEVTRIEVTIGLDGDVDFDQASVRVAFTASTRKGVLTVPVAALLALREGGYGLEVIGDNGTRRIVAVETGLFAAGRVEITGTGIGEGTTVGMPS